MRRARVSRETTNVMGSLIADQVKVLGKFELPYYGSLVYRLRVDLVSDEIIG